MKMTLSFKIVDTGDSEWIHEDFRTDPPMDEWVRENFNLEDLFERVGVEPEPGFYEFYYDHSSGDMNWSAPSGSWSKEDRERLNALFFSLLKRYVEVILSKREQDLPKQDEIDLGAHRLLMELFQRACDKAIAHGQSAIPVESDFEVIDVCTRCGPFKVCTGQRGSLLSVLFPAMTPIGTFRVGNRGRVQLFHGLVSGSVIITAGFVSCECSFSRYLNSEFAGCLQAAILKALPHVARDGAINLTQKLDSIQAFKQKLIAKYQLDEAEIRERADEAEILQTARETMLQDD